LHVAECGTPRSLGDTPERSRGHKAHGRFREPNRPLHRFGHRTGSKSDATLEAYESRNGPAPTFPGRPMMSACGSKALLCCFGEGKLLMRAGKDRQSAKKLHRNSDINSLEMSHRQASETRRFLTKKGSVRFAVRRRRLRVGGYRAGRPSRGRTRFCGSQTIIGPVGRVMTPR
jgi:hypothetical protein